MIEKPHLDHTQALSSYVSGSLGTLKVFLYELGIFSNPLINITTKRFNKSRSKICSYLRNGKTQQRLIIVFMKKQSIWD
ncbi:hypothetical protein MPG43_04715 [Helicobacter pylori]|uniref:hypothetical protein n=1 Tax=Helicobacter pylori TaxID=210 RepID=UPI001FD425C7|nr:hypothetical protein [Helicobacter pylori]UOS03815.1 hypothetical protein MPG43_04715 [Helicobacter pylori]